MKQRVYEILYRELVENYANGKGRTTTADFWLTISAMTFVYGLVTFITGLATFIPYGFLYAISLGGGVLTALTVLLTLPTIMLVARRLRDSNNDPTLMILVFVPILGWLVLLYLLCKRSAPTQEVNITNEQISAEPSIKEKKSISGVFIVAILVLGWITSSVGTSMMGHNYMVEETAFGNLGQGAFTKKANRLLRSDSATTEGYLVVKEYYQALANGDYHSAYRELSSREMERYGTFDLWQQAKAKEQRSAVESIQLDYVSRTSMASVNVYDLNYTDAFVLGIKNYANFKGRASRSEYWRFMAGMMMVQGTLGVVAILCKGIGLYNFESIIDTIRLLVTLFFVIPNIAITTRRMHDIGRSGWTQLISFIPIIGFFIFLNYELKRGDEGENGYGERTAYIPITRNISESTGLEATPSRKQDWVMGITIFVLQSIVFGNTIGDILWYGINANGYI